MNSTNPDKNNRREIFGWLVYDWANSAFYTTVVSVLLGPYLVSLAQSDVGENGVILSLGAFGAITPKNLFSYSIFASVFIQLFLLPTLGSIADYTNLKKRLMMFFCYTGVAASCCLFFVTGDDYLWGSFLLVIATLSFGTANVFYNAYLVDITTEDKRNLISSYGFASGYIGGVLVLVLNLQLVNNAERFGITTGTAVRLSLLFASLWWGAFALITFLTLRSRGAVKKLPPGKNVITVGFSELFNTFRQLRRLRQTSLFLVAFLFYNDGIQAVINHASIFLAQELFVAKGLKEDQSFLIGIFLVAQVSALAGSIIFERIARRIGSKNTIILSLIVWICIVIYAYGFLDSTAQAWIMAGFIGLVLGASQALSRSLYSKMIPEGKESSFFGFYEIAERGASLLGAFVFGTVAAATGSYRQAILALIVFFIVGILILFFTDTDKAIKEAGQYLPKEAEKEAV